MRDGSCSTIDASSSPASALPSRSAVAEERLGLGLLVPDSRCARAIAIIARAFDSGFCAPRTRRARAPPTSTGGFGGIFGRLAACGKIDVRFFSASSSF